MTVSRTSRRAASRPRRPISGTGVPAGAAKTGMSRLAPSVLSWSTAAGRYGSAATSMGRRPSFTTWRASLAADVVLPEPCRPTRATTAGLPDRWKVRSPAESSAGQLLVDDLHDLLAGVERLQDLGPDGALADPGRELLDDLEVDVGLEQRQPDLAHGGIDVGLGDAAATGQGAEGLAEAIGEGVEHAGARAPVDRVRRSAAALRRWCAGSGDTEASAVYRNGRATPPDERPAGARSIGRCDVAPVTLRSGGPGPTQANRASTKASGSNGRRSPTFSPTPTKRTGTPRACSMAKTIPPFDVESSLVRTIPVSPVASWKASGLRQAVLAGRGVQDEEHLRPGPGQAPVDDPAHLGQLVHQVRLRVEASGRVRDEDVDVTGDRRVERVVDDGRRVGARGVGDDRRRRALPPQAELVDRRRAERVAGGEQHAAAGGALPGRDLADRGGLAGPVHAHHQDDRRPTRGRRLEGPATRARRQQPGELVAHRGLRAVRVAPRPGPLDDLDRERRADVAGDERLLDLLPGRGVWVAQPEDPAQAGHEAAAAPGDAGGEVAVHDRLGLLACRPRRHPRPRAGGRRAGPARTAVPAAAASIVGRVGGGELGLELRLDLGVGDGRLVERGLVERGPGRAASGSSLGFRRQNMRPPCVGAGPDQPAGSGSGEVSRATAAHAGGDRAGLLDPEADHAAHGVLADRDPVQRVGGLDGAAIVRDHDELGGLGESAERLHEPARRSPRRGPRRPRRARRTGRVAPRASRRGARRPSGRARRRRASPAPGPSCRAAARRSPRRSGRGRSGRSGSGARTRPRTAAGSGGRRPSRARRRSPGTGGR